MTADRIAECRAVIEACPCWANNQALGHEGHCCFLRDDRDRRINGGFKPDAEVCHVPEVSDA